MIAREKRDFCADILLLENMAGRTGGRLANLTKLWVIWASTSIIPSLSS
jgi:hypothetical protein